MTHLLAITTLLLALGSMILMDLTGTETQAPLWVLDILWNLRLMILTVEHLHQPHLKVIVDTNAGKSLEGHQETLWEKFSREAGEGAYAPFEGKEEWELSHWLSTEGLSQGAIDHFWKLKWVSHNFLFTH